MQHHRHDSMSKLSRPMAPSSTPKCCPLPLFFPLFPARHCGLVDTVGTFLIRDCLFASRQSKCMHSIRSTYFAVADIDASPEGRCDVHGLGRVCGRMRAAAAAAVLARCLFGLQQHILQVKPHLERHDVLVARGDVGNFLACNALPGHKG